MIRPLRLQAAVVAADVVSLQRASYQVEADLIDFAGIPPRHFRRGIAARLLTWVEEAYPAASEWRVSTGTRNVPAVALYQRHGYQVVGETEVAPGIWVTHLAKRQSHGSRSFAGEEPKA